MSPPSPPRIRPRGLKQAKAKVPQVSQCDACVVYRCGMRDQMAYDEVMAEYNGVPKPECSDRELNYFERMVTE